MRLGIDVLLSDAARRSKLQGKRLGLLAHPASLTRSFQHSLDALIASGDLDVAAAFGPQHGMRGDKQDNMVESPDFVDPVHKIPVFSLYGEVRRPTDAMMANFDVLLFDVQDVGCRIYTFLTTLLYCLEACAKHGKALWVLDRPNPAGRPIEGLSLQPSWESFVGAAPGIPMRHGLTLGEFAHWFKRRLKIDVELEVVALEHYDPTYGPGFGWPQGELPWVNPSPNAASLSMARAYAGTVMIEGTTLSEGRGTTRPLELVGAPDLDIPAVLAVMRQLAPEWMQGAKIRPCFFEPTFHKHKGVMNAGFQIHVDDADYEHLSFKPYRLMTLAFRAIRVLRADYPLWRDFKYEYEESRLAIDLINGSPLLREWVDDVKAPVADFEVLCRADEKKWESERRDCLLYPA